MHRNHRRPPARLSKHFALIALLTALHSHAQTLTKEYVRLNGQVIAIENAPTTTTSGPQITFSPASLPPFTSQIVNTTSTAKSVTVSNPGSATLTLSISITGANPSDFSQTSTCGSALTAGSQCQISVTFTPSAATTRGATISIADNAPNSPQSIALTGTGASSSTPTDFSTYVGSFGSNPPAFSGNAAVLPIRAYNPAGATQINYLQILFENAATSALEYMMYAQTDGAGGYTLRFQNDSGFAPAYPFLSLNPSGSTVTLPTPIPFGTMQLTAYRFALTPNEFQLDITLTRSDTFNDQIVILGVIGNNAELSDPWGAVNAQWSSGAPAVPGVILSTTAITFANEAVSSTGTQTVNVTNSGNAPLSITSLQISDADAADFTASGCTAAVSPGNYCTITVAFDPLDVGSRTATLSIVDNAPNSPQIVMLTGTGYSGQVPTTFTTYIGNYGMGFQTFDAASTVIPFRAWIPSGANQLNYMEIVLNSAANTAEYAIYAGSDGSGNYVLRLTDFNTNAPAYPFLTMNANGTTVTLGTPITLGTLQISAYRFALAGNEFQLDLTVNRTGTFTDQIIILGVIGNNAAYSAPWYAVNGQWSSQ